jgi:hypothetical protein
MTGALLLGAFAGLGLITIAAGLAPRRISLAEALEAIIREPRPPLVTAEEGGWAARLGRPAVTLLAALGLPTRGLRRDHERPDSRPHAGMIGHAKSSFDTLGERQMSASSCTRSVDMA